MKPTNRISNGEISKTRILMGECFGGELGDENDRLEAFFFFVSEVQQCYDFQTLPLNLGQIALRNVG